MIKECYLANLDIEITEDDLRESLEHYGEVVSIELIPSEGIAYVKFKKAEDAILALRSMEGIDFLGRQLRVGWVEPKIRKNYNQAS